MSSVTRASIHSNLLALVEHLSIYPSQTVQYAADLLGVEPPASISDLLSMSGADAVDALSAEAILQREGWAA